MPGPLYLRFNSVPPPPASSSCPQPQVPEVQLHEPILTTTRAEGLKAEFEEAYGLLSKVRCIVAGMGSWVLACAQAPISACNLVHACTCLASCSQHHAGLKLPIHTSRQLPPARHLLSSRQVGVPINLVSYYDDIGATYEWAVQLPVQAVTLDFLGVPGAATPSRTMELIRRHGFPAAKRLGAGVVDGRSVWADDGALPYVCSAWPYRM